jgi:hypothetical protein
MDVNNENDSRLKIIESNEDRVEIEFCGVRITGYLDEGESGFIAVQMPNSPDEQIFVNSGKRSLEWTHGDDEMRLTFKAVQRALGLSEAIKSVRAYLAL